MTFDELTRRLREQQASLDAVQAETGVGLLCTACLPDLREHLSVAGDAVPPETPSSLGPAEPREGDEPADAGSGSPVLAGAHEAR
jgi:hypothetical protein